MITPPEIQHHDRIPSEFKFLGRIANPFRDDDIFWFLQYQSILVIFTGGNFTNKKTGITKYLTYQACFPMEALTWTMARFNDFFTPPKDGGLAAGKLAMDEEVDGEKLSLDRGVCTGGPNEGGYELSNLSRVDYGFEGKNSTLFSQSFTFPDGFLFNGGLLEFWRDLSERYQKGTL